MTININGSLVHRHEDTIFIALPMGAWRSCGKCYCKECEGREGMWDTLAVSKDAPENKPGETHRNDYAWTVHHPVITGSAKYMKTITEIDKKIDSLITLPIG